MIATCDDRSHGLEVVQFQLKSTSLYDCNEPDGSFVMRVSLFQLKSTSLYDCNPGCRKAETSGSCVSVEVDLSV